MPEPNISTCQDVGNLGCGYFLSVGGEFVVQVVELLRARPLVVSVGGVVQHVRSGCPCSGVWHLQRTQPTAMRSMHSHCSLHSDSKKLKTRCDLRILIFRKVVK